MNYWEKIRQQKEEKVALVEDEAVYTYGELVRQAAIRREELPITVHRQIYRITGTTIREQLVDFLACQGTALVPVIVAESNKRKLYTEQSGLEETEQTVIPPEACMGVMTSGTTGTGRLLFRTYDSWAGYFDTQNRIFEMAEDTVLFAQGSLAFTGNLNFYMAMLCTGQTIVSTMTFQPRKWLEQIVKYGVNYLYLIPAKVRALRQAYESAQRKNLYTPGAIQIRHMIAGSQSMGQADADAMRQLFPGIKIILYYGSSEYSYITWVKDGEMNERQNLIGKPCPGVQVWLENGEIMVQTPCCVIGKQKSGATGDLGSMDLTGNFYFEGRKDDIFNINGRKICALPIEAALERLPGVKRAAVFAEQQKDKDLLKALVELEVNGDYQGERWALEQLKNAEQLSELPRHIQTVPYLPVTESGKLKRKEAADMAAYNLFEQRISVRNFSDEPVSKEQLYTILNAGLCAPTAKNLKPFTLMVIQDKEKLLRLAAAGDTAKMLRKASAAIAVIGDLQIQPCAELLVADCSAATENMLLAATQLGLGACWCGVVSSDWSQAVKEILELPEETKPVSIIAVGCPKRAVQGRKRWDNTKICWEKWKKFD